MKQWFMGQDGLRPIWRAVLVLCLGYLVSLGAGLGLAALMNALYGVWGVNQDNILRAPAWIRLISGHWGEWSSMAQNLLLIPLAALLCRILGLGRLRRGRHALKGLALGAGFALALAGALLLMDALRMGRPLSKPLVSWEIFIPLAMYLCAALGMEALLRGALAQALTPWPPWARWGLGAAAFALLTAPAWQPLTLINLALMGLLLAIGAEKAGGYLAGAMARFGLYAMLYAALGCEGGASVALYECYPAGHDLLSGVWQGPLGGLLATLALLAALGGLGAYYLRKKGRRKKGK